MYNKEYEIVPSNKFSVGIKELAQYAELFYFFTWRDIKIKYKQTALGFLWAVFQPLILMVVFTFFLSDKLGFKENELPYPVFVYSGLLFWNLFSSGLNSAANSMVNNAGIIKKIYFPRLIIPMSSVLVVLFDFFMALIVFFGILFYFNIPITYKLFIYMPLGLLLTIISTFGLGCLLAALTIKYRDFRYVVPFFVQILMFVSPVIYPIKNISNELVQKILLFNPMNASIYLFRNCFSTDALDYTTILYGLTSALVLFVVGLYYFRKTEYYFADIV